MTLAAAPPNDAAYDHVLRPGRKAVDAAGLALIAYAAMNLNGVVALTTHVEGALSPIVLVLSVILILSCATRQRFTSSFGMFAVFMLVYLIGGSIPLVTSGTLDPSHIVQYLGTFLYCTAVTFYCAERGLATIGPLLAALQVMYLIDCVAALNHRLLGEYFAYARPLVRATGFFHNPNETGIMALYYLTLIVTGPKPAAKIWTWAKVALAVTTLVLTFSKTGILIGVVLAALYLVSRRAYMPLLLSGVMLLGSIPVLDAIARDNPFDLGTDQRLRIEEIAEIFSGKIDDKVTTGRTTLWAIGLERIATTLPFGSGLGSFHRMEGGIEDPAHVEGGGVVNGDWLGVHNLFLMVLGESGLAALVALLAFLATLANALRANPQRQMGLGIMIILVGDMMATHGALAIRLHDVMLALAMGLTAAVPVSANAAKPASPVRRVARTPIPVGVLRSRVRT